MFSAFRRMSNAVKERAAAESDERGMESLEDQMKSRQRDSECCLETMPKEDNSVGEDEMSDLKNHWTSEQIRLKQHCRLEDTDPWATNRLALGNSDAEEVKDMLPLRYVAGTDISFVKGDLTNACAAIVVVELPKLEVVYEDISMVKLTAPYIPGFLAFREAEFLIEKLERLKKLKPEFHPMAVIVDGNGILHTREFGLACHVGVRLGLPTVGAAKTLYHFDGIGKNEEHQNKIKALLKKGGDQFPLISQSGCMLGVALRSCDKTTNPIYISPGHNISMETAVWLVRLCCKYRVPEPVRQADIKSRQYIRDNLKSHLS